MAERDETLRELITRVYEAVAGGQAKPPSADASLHERTEYVMGKLVENAPQVTDHNAMPQTDREFWVDVTIWGGAFGTMFGYGLYALIENRFWWGAILTPTGLAGLLMLALYLTGRLKRAQYPVMIAALVLTWAAIGFQVWHEPTPPITPVSPPASRLAQASPPPASPPSRAAVPKKFYSVAKNRLADACTALIDDLNQNALGADAAAADLMQLWIVQNNLLRSAAEKIDAKPFAMKLREIRDRLTAHEKAIVAITSANDPFRAELLSVLDQNRGAQELNLFREALDRADKSVAVLAMIRQTNNLGLVAAFLPEMAQTLGNVQQRAMEFGDWANASRKRIDELERELKDD